MKISWVIIVVMLVLMGCVTTEQKHFNPKLVDQIDVDQQYYFEEMIDFLATGECIREVKEE